MERRDLAFSPQRSTVISLPPIRNGTRPNLAATARLRSATVLLPMPRRGLGRSSKESST